MFENLLFPFGEIEKDSRIVVYGAGNVGSKLLNFIRKTKFCKIICFLDKNYADKKDFPHKVLAPHEIANIEEYLYVLISILLPKRASEAKEVLITFGVPEEKIIFLNSEFSEFSEFQSRFFKPKYLTEIDNGSLKIAFVLRGGLGDELIAGLLIKEIRNFMQNALIDCYCSQKELFSKMPFIDNVYHLSRHNEENDYDCIFNVRRFVSFEKINLEKIKAHSEKLYEFCVDSINICDKVSGWIFNDKCYTDYCLRLGKNRIEQSNPHGVLPFDRYASMDLEFDKNGFEKLRELNLENKKYIVICNNAGEKTTSSRSSKLWPAKYFDILIRLIKSDYPDLTIVWAGTTYDFGRLENADMDLIGKTNIHELCALLKHSTLTIGIEGGIIHLNHFLGKKSVCLFGSTSIEVYGYEENINIKSNYPEKCGCGCEWITNSWADKGCMLAENPLCMIALKPEKVYEKINLYLSREIKL